MTDDTPRHPELDDAIAVLARLRAPGGCVWNREQTHESLVRYLIEETYELVDALETGTRDDRIEELGDLLYQVIFHSDIAAEAGEFTIEDVAAHLTAKMIGRHPHVFGDESAATVADVIEVWEARKAAEKSERTSVLDGIPQGMPSLALAEKLLGRASKVGWAPPVGDGVEAPETEEQLGATLLALVAAARQKGLDPERALRSTLRGMQADIRSAENPTS